ncbi:MAG: hypothetical protein JWM54_125 [Acidobacteriaceae bacterium]|nr:hypothetical protein [Acidobacteriaceae bacterium]
MASRLSLVFLFLLSWMHGCGHSATPQASQASRPKPDGPAQVLAVYEAWFGHPQHISIGYSSHDPAEIRKQIRQAKALGITGFVVDWYGYRQPFIDHSYALLQTIAAEEQFHLAMMYDETDEEDGATDEAIEDFKLFHKTYLAADAPGRKAYLHYDRHPVIFIFPKGRHTDWNRVRAEVAKWESSPLLIDEYAPNSSVPGVDGFYAWVNPGPKSWTTDGSNWGEEYLTDFYNAMQSKFPDKIAVGGAWASFDDSKASWGQNRHIAPRCGKTLADTSSLWKQHSSSYYMPYLLVATWNDYEEGTAIEKGVDSCGSAKLHPVLP